MRGMILIAVMWLIGIGGALAQTVAPAGTWGATPEKLDYVVSVGPFTLGAATLDYKPVATQKSYVLSATVRGGVPFFAIDDGWTAAGTGTPQAFLSQSFHIMQQENKYRSDKVLTFDRARGTVDYKNQFDSSEKPLSQPLTPADLRDPLSALYALRAVGPSVLAAPHELMVMGIKTPFALHVAAGVPEKLRWRGQKIATQRVVMTMDNPKKHKSESWTIWVRPEDGLLPVKISASLGVGSFSAILQ